jgi:AcrR family transcriptional regulator
MKTRMSGGQRRDVIIEAAIRLFAERGFEGTTTKELARAVGVTEPVLYRHFQTKSDLYAAIIDSKAREGEERLKCRLGPFVDSDDDEGFFTALADITLEQMHRDPAYVRLLLFSALEQRELGRLFYDRQIHFCFNFVCSYIKRRIKQGAFRKMNPNLAARAFFGMVNHHGLMGVLFDDKLVAVNRKTAARELVRTFLSGVSGVHCNS